MSNSLNTQEAPEGGNSAITPAFRRIIDTENATTRTIADNTDSQNDSGFGRMITFPGDLDLSESQLAPSDFPLHICVQGNLTIDQKDYFLIENSNYDIDGDVIVKGRWNHAMNYIPGKNLVDMLNDRIEDSKLSVGGEVRQLIDM